MKKYIAGFMLGLMIFMSFAKPVEVAAKEKINISVSCAVPLPPSAPGEEKKDMITAVVGLTVLGRLLQRMCYHPIHRKVPTGLKAFLSHYIQHQQYYSSD